jgi:hypothetical protein
MLENQRRGTRQTLGKLTAVVPIENLRLDAQEALDDLWAEHEIPFKTTAYEVLAGGHPGYYMVRIQDQRVPSLFIFWNGTESFKAAVRTVLERTLGKRRTA